MSKSIAEKQSHHTLELILTEIEQTWIHKHYVQKPPVPRGGERIVKKYMRNSLLWRRKLAAAASVGYKCYGKLINGIDVLPKVNGYNS